MREREDERKIQIKTEREGMRQRQSSGSFEDQIRTLLRNKEKKARRDESEEEKRGDKKICEKIR